MRELKTAKGKNAKTVNDNIKENLTDYTKETYIFLEDIPSY